MFICVNSGEYYRQNPIKSRIFLFSQKYSLPPRFFIEKRIKIIPNAKKYIILVLTFTPKIWKNRHKEISKVRGLSLFYCASTSHRGEDNMAKLKRFYLFIAALVFAKSYNISAAYAYPDMTDADCWVAQQIMWWYDNHPEYKDNPGNYGAEQELRQHCNNGAVVDQSVWDCEATNMYYVECSSDGSKAWCNEVLENYQGDIWDCVERGLTYKECSLEWGWECNTMVCPEGEGYEPEEDRCRPCGNGTYQARGQFGNSATWYYGDYCEACKIFSPGGDNYSQFAKSPEYATSEDDCYIEAGTKWNFEDSTGRGSVYFGQNGTTKDCYYDGTLGSAGTIGS